MGGIGIWQVLIVLAIVLILFGGGGKIPRLMKDMGQGINAFKRGLKTDDKAKEASESESPKVIDQEAEVVASTTEDKDKAVNG